MDPNLATSGQSKHPSELVEETIETTDAAGDPETITEEFETDQGAGPLDSSPAASSGTDSGASDSGTPPLTIPAPTTAPTGEAAPGEAPVQGQPDAGPDTTVAGQPSSPQDAGPSDTSVAYPPVTGNDTTAADGGAVSESPVPATVADSADTPDVGSGGGY